MTDQSPEKGQRRVRVAVHGRVQDVNFRSATAERARRFGVAGWVANRPDGSVEAVFEGPDEAVAEMLRFAAEGPRWARVDRVESRQEPVQGEAGFEIRY